MKKNFFRVSISIVIILFFISIGLNTTAKNVAKDQQKNVKSITTTYQASNKKDEIFSKYYSKAKKKVKSLSIDEKIGQMLLVRYPSKNQKNILKQYKFGGYIFFGKDFKGKSKTQIKNRMAELQKSSKIPLLIAVDEEGGTVVRVSSNKKLAKSKFKSPSALYKIGGFKKIKQDTIEKSKLLSSLGINLNLAPVVDVSTSSKDYMYKRSLGKNAKLTSIYAKTVISASKGRNVSYTLKHFPGYGNNVDTHKGISIDRRTYKSILNKDLLPFKEGIKAGAESVLVSHNIVTSIDNKNPASLSKKINNLLRKNLEFSGVIITDDLDMGAVSKDKNATVKAILAGNDIIITTDYKGSIKSIKKAIKDGKISEKQIDNAVTRIIAWKYYKGLLK